MTDKHAERQIASERATHIRIARTAAERLLEQARAVLREIDAGHDLWGAHLVIDAVELERRLSALQALREAAGIYQAEEAGRDGRSAT